MTVLYGFLQILTFESCAYFIGQA